MLYKKISVALFDKTYPLHKRVIEFDPAEIYSRIKVKTHKRHQSFSISELFPDKSDNTCACGCGVKLTGRRTRWASPKCSDFPYAVYQVIRGDTGYIGRLMINYVKHECSVCHCPPYVLEKNLATGIQVDHILAVANGGGGGWLGNYRFICHKCHGKKSAADNKLRKQPILTTKYNQIILNL